MTIKKLTAWAIVVITGGVLLMGLGGTQTGHGFLIGVGFSLLLVGWCRAIVWAADQLWDR